MVTSIFSFSHNVFYCIREIILIATFNVMFANVFGLVHSVIPKQALVFTFLQYMSFEDTVGKGEIARDEVTSDFSFHHMCFLPVWRTFFHLNPIWKWQLQFLSFWKSLKCIVWERVNPFPHNDAVWRLWETSLLKTLWENEKLLVTSNSSFSHSVFYPFG